MDFFLVGGRSWSRFFCKPRFVVLVVVLVVVVEVVVVVVIIVVIVVVVSRGKITKKRGLFFRFRFAAEKKNLHLS